MSIFCIDVIDNRNEANEDFSDIAVYYGDQDFGNKVYMCQSYVDDDDSSSTNNSSSDKSADSDSSEDADNKWYLFLPYDTETVGDYKLVLPENTMLSIDGTVYKDGDVIPTELDNSDIQFLSHSGKSLCSGTLTVCYGNSLQSMFLVTSTDDAELVFTDRYANIEAVLITTDAEGNLETSTSCITGGRGGSTWASCPKRPLKINLSEEMELLGMSAASKYALVANYMDQTNMKDAIVYTAAGKIGMTYYPECEHVNLYVNGEYEGLYLLCTRINSRGGCVEFADDLDDANDIANNNTIGIPETEILYEGTRDEIRYSLLDNNPLDISGSYLMEFELEGKPQEEQYVNSWFNTDNKTIVMNSPQYASEEETTYIANYVREAERAVYSEDGINTDTGLSIQDYLDINSWSQMCLMQNFFALQDYSDGSLFMYKLAGDDKLYGGPIWDYDKSMTDDYYTDVKFAYTDKATLGGWYSELYKFDDVFANIQSVYINDLSDALAEMIENYVPDTIENISAAMEMDNIRWSHEDGYEASRAEEVYEWLINRKNLFDSIWIDGEKSEYADNINLR